MRAMDLGPEPGVNTLLSHYAEEEKLHGAVTAPIFQNSLFVFDRIQDLMTAMMESPWGPPHHYSRLSNPTIHIAEQKIAKLEGAESCKLTGSGSAAIALAIMSNVQAGSHVVTLDTIYRPTLLLLDQLLAKYGVETTFVTGLDTTELLDAIRPETTLIYLESPSSLLFRLQEIEAIAKVAREKGITTAIDNTYATPIQFNPIRLGIDLVCHSGSKYLGGHSDLTAGAICGTKSKIERVIREELNLLGNIASPFTAWLLTRGMRTLKLRVKHHEQTANEVAMWLEKRPEIDQVHHLGLDSYPQKALFLEMMRGSGGLFSFEPKCQDGEKVMAFVNALKLFQKGVSWGGFESLVVTLPVHPLDYPEPRWVVRLYCGLEDAADLIRDLESAMHLLCE